ncbi:MAG: hypothetical protein KDD69_19200, partial [Bdellovibrionales bacterium]|nr:hypothetical protein [Bdellovibrionales bacterium]
RGEEAAQTIARLLREAFLGVPTANTAGARYAADMLQHLTKEQRRRLLGRLQQTHPETYQRIRSAV